MEYSLQIVITQGIMIIILLLLIIYLLHQKRAIKLQKRFDAFTLKSVVDEEKSIFDYIMNFLYKVMKKVTNLLSHSEVLKKHSLRYDKFIKYENKDKV